MINWRELDQEHTSKVQQKILPLDEGDLIHKMHRTIEHATPPPRSWMQKTYGRICNWFLIIICPRSVLTTTTSSTFNQLLGIFELQPLSMTELLHLSEKGGL